MIILVAIQASKVSEMLHQGGSSEDHNVLSTAGG